MRGPINSWLVSGALLLPAAAAAQPISLVAGTVNMFRDSRGANDVGATAGERFQFGADVVGGSAGVTLGATYALPPTATVTQFDCGALTVNPNFCSRTTAFNAGRLQPWTLRFVRGADKLAASLQSQFDQALLFRRIATVVTDIDVGAVDDWRWRGALDEFAAAAEDLGAPQLVLRAQKLANRKTSDTR